MLGWVADFYCAAAKLVVEVDGSYHEPVKDAHRDRVMNEHGLSVLRLKASDVEADIDWATGAVVAEAKRLVDERGTR